MEIKSVLLLLLTLGLAACGAIDEKLTDVYKQSDLAQHIEMPDDIYAYTDICESGLLVLDSTTKTLIDLAEKIERSAADAEYMELFAAEWNRVANTWENFDEVNAYIDVIYEAFDEEAQTEGADSEAPEAVIKEAVINTFLKLKDAGQAGASHLLSGIQFGDPAAGDLDAVLKVSAELNLPHWRLKLEGQCLPSIEKS